MSDSDELSFFMSSNLKITSDAPTNTIVINNTPTFTLLEKGKTVFAGATTTYSQSGIKYSQAGVLWGGMYINNQGNPPDNVKVDTTT